MVEPAGPPPTTRTSHSFMAVVDVAASRGVMVGYLRTNELTASSMIHLGAQFSEGVCALYSDTCATAIAARRGTTRARLAQVDLAAARQPARPALGIESRRQRRRHDDLRGGLATQLFKLAAGALDGGGGAGRELLDRVGEGVGVDLEDEGQQTGLGQELRLADVHDGPAEIR